MSSIFSRVFGLNDYSLLKLDGYSSKGRRDTNNDSFLLLEDNYDRTLVLVCDGVDAKPHGDFASAQVIEIFRNSFDQFSEFSSAEDFFRKTALVGATMIMQKGFESAAYKQAATTLTGFVADGELLHVINVGDSRVYRYRNGKLERLTKDHTIVQSMIENGQTNADVARYLPEKKILTSVIDGTLSTIKIDFQSFALSDGDLIFAVSDGFHEVFDDNKILSLLKKNLTKPTLARIMVEEAYNAGSLQNITFTYYRHGAM